MSYVLEIKNVTKKFGDFTAVDSVSFNVEDGGFFSILGGSGCGKTTLLRMIAGFEKETKGELLIRGESMEGIPPENDLLTLSFKILHSSP
jgi:ABC-type Fe3+/spermidine/putrescine transport system ATPase subunit